MKSILLTGFRSFAGELINPSELLLNIIPDHFIAKKLILPVSYEKSFSMVSAELQTGKYPCVIMLGQAGGRAQVCLERFVVNLIDSEIPDEDQLLFKGKRISLHGPEAFQAQFPIDNWITLAQSKNLPLVVSNSAGTYVCNSLSYQVAENFSVRGVKSLFIHLPFLPEQTLNKTPETPSLSLEEMQKCLEFVLGKIV